MTTQIHSILRALLEEDTPASPDCAWCASQLAAFVDVELTSNDAKARFPAVAAHLDQCLACQQAYQELLTLLALEQAGDFVAPPVAPSFDFGYLPRRPAPRPTQPPGRPWRLDDLGRLVIQFTAELLAGLQGPLLQPAFLKGDAPVALTYELTGQIDDLDVRINAEPQRRNPQRLTVEVAVDIHSRGGWPHLAGSVVTLRRGADLIDEQETDAFGKVVFDNVPAADLPLILFEITPF